jgi:cytohesin
VDLAEDLLHAAGNINKNKLKQLLIAGADRFAAFQCAVQGRNEKAAQQLLDAVPKAAVSAAGEGGTTLLHIAAEYGFAVGPLLRARASVKAVDNKGRTPLHVAAHNGQAAAVELLLAAHASVTAGNSRGRTPLHDAASQGHLAATKALLAAKASVAAADSNGSTPLHMAARNSLTAAMDLLIEAKADVAATDAEGRSPLHDAALHRTPDALQLLLRAKASAAAVDDQGRTALHAACGERVIHEAVVKALVAADAALLSAVDSEGHTPLHVAAAEGEYDAIQLLIDAGADIATTDSSGRTPLHAAAARGYEPGVQVLLDAGAPAAAADAGGSTPLHEAVSEETPYSEIGSDDEFDEDCEGGESKCDTIDYTRAWGRHFMKQRLGIVSKLLAAGADPCATDAAGNTPLLLAAKEGRSGIMELLLETNTLHAGHIAAALKAARKARHVDPATVLAAAQAAAPAAPKRQLQQQKQQQKQQSRQRGASEAGSSGHLRGIKAEPGTAADGAGGLVAGQAGGVSHQQPAAAAAASLGPEAVQLLQQVTAVWGSVPQVSAQEHYFMLADQPLDGSELLQLCRDRLAPQAAPTSRNTRQRAVRGNAAASGANGGCHSMQQAHPDLVPGFERLVAALPEQQQQLLQQQQLQQPPAAKKRKLSSSNTAAAAAAVEPSDAASTLLLALCCLRLWEGQQLQEPDCPLLLQLLLFGGPFPVTGVEQQQQQQPGSNGGAGGGGSSRGRGTGRARVKQEPAGAS